MRFLKKYRFLWFAVAVILLNYVASFLIEPANGSSETMWKEYYQEEEIDTICAATVVEFCKERHIAYHIKDKTVTPE